MTHGSGPVGSKGLWKVSVWLEFCAIACVVNVGRATAASTSNPENSFEKCFMAALAKSGFEAGYVLLSPASSHSAWCDSGLDGTAYNVLWSALIRPLRRLTRNRGRKTNSRIARRYRTPIQ